MKNYKSNPLMLAKTPHITDISTLFAQFFASVQGLRIILKQLLRCEGKINTACQTQCTKRGKIAAMTAKTKADVSETSAFAIFLFRWGINRDSDFYANDAMASGSISTRRTFKPTGFTSAIADWTARSSVVASRWKWIWGILAMVASVPSSITP